MARTKQASPPPAFEFTQAEIDERFVDHWEFADDILGEIKKLVPEGGPFIEVSPLRLKLAIESAYQDIARYKNYHQREPRKEHLDCVKRCAYLVKWIIRFKPFVVLDEDGRASDNSSIVAHLEVINELFALHLFELHLSDELGVDIELSEEKTLELAYDLLYRQMPADALIAVFQLLKDCCVPRMRTVGFLRRLRRR